MPNDLNSGAPTPDHSAADSNILGKPSTLAEYLASRLYIASSHPFRAARELFHFRLLRALGGKWSFLPAPMKHRLRKSAAKRDPRRYLNLVQSDVPRPARGAIGTSIRSPEFVAYGPPPPIKPDVKVIAFYLPQFHAFPENDLWWGKGFTEWTNVGKAQPMFDGHYQPHCPIHVGYYDLRVPSVMEEQAKIAREYGVGGFAYYFYWFGGKTLMETPLRAMLANPSVDMPFCLSWANENWTRRWDGADHDILIGQNHSIEDSRALLRHLADYFRDPRYIRIDNKPVFLVYRPEIIPDIRATTDMWRAEAKALGFDGIYLLATQTSGIKDPRPKGFDAAVEFPPLEFAAPKQTIGYNISNPNFTGRLHDYREVVKFALESPEPAFPRFRSAMLGWDNSARKPLAADIFVDFSIDTYRHWLAEICKQAVATAGAKQDRKIVFVNAWNEWAEGTHLEPDQWMGFAYLQATYDALAEMGGKSV